jgi:hypothetical protein
MEEQIENNAAAAGEKSSSTSHFYYLCSGTGGLALVLVLGGAAAGGAASAVESRSISDDSNNPVGLPTVPAPSVAPAGLSPVPTVFPVVVVPTPGPMTLMPTVFQPRGAFRPCDAPSDCASQACAWRYDGSVARARPKSAVLTTTAVVIRRPCRMDVPIARACPIWPCVPDAAALATATPKSAGPP